MHHAMNKHAPCNAQDEQPKCSLSVVLVYPRDAQDKQRLLRQLQGLGEVAAMTGDGVNDAPALQQANFTGTCDLSEERTIISLHTHG